MNWLEVPEDYDEGSLAAFIEGELLFSSDEYLSLTEIRSLFPSGRQPTEDELSFAFGEIERRADDWGGFYPYLVDDRGVLFDRDATSNLYSLLLLLSLRGMPVRENRDFPRSDPVFDAVVRAAFAAHLDARTLLFGWPPRGGRPAKFSLAVKWLAEQIGVPLRTSVEQIPDHLRDGGVDVVAWKPFPDGKNAFSVYLIQNTVQWSFRSKAHDVRPLRWVGWLWLGAEPCVGFAVPFAMPDGDPWWDDVADGTHIVMDRGRLMHELSGADPTVWQEWPQLLEFVSSEVTMVRELGSAEPVGSVPPVRGRRKK